MRLRTQQRAVCAAASVVAVFGGGAFLPAVPTASAAEAAPGWMLTARSYPTNFAPGGKGTIGIDIFNVGAQASEGIVTVTDTLPPGLTVADVGDLVAVQNGVSPILNHNLWDCSGNGPGGLIEGASVITCTSNPATLPSLPGGGGIPADEDPNNLAPIGILVNAGPQEQTGLQNHVTISGGGASAPASTTDPIAVSTAKPPFGFTSWDGWFSNPDGTIATQAGSHPYALTLSFDLASVLRQTDHLLTPAGEPRVITIDLPPGVVGDPTAVPQCPLAELSNATCPQASEIGVTKASLAGGVPPELGFPVFNVVPPPGVPAELAFNFSGILTRLDSTLRTGGDSGITTTVQPVAQRELLHSVTTIWGVPGEESHDRWRNGKTGGCRSSEISESENYCVVPARRFTRQPFFTLPTACGSSLPFTIRATSWQSPNDVSEATFHLHDAAGEPVGIQGCERLGFGPQLSTATESAQADAPTAFTAEVRPPLGGLQENGLLSTSALKAASVVLPEGLVVNPGQAAGLEACSPTQANLTTPAEQSLGQENAASPHCPPASQVGTAKVTSPLLVGALEPELEGNVYILESNPPELKLLVAASGEGVNLKQVGVVHLNEQTGRLTTVFDDIPQQPFTNFKLDFDGGPRAALVTPAECGSYQTAADFTPWSSPFTPHFFTKASFDITAGAAGAPCPSKPLSFTPTLAAGTTNIAAGASSGFTLKVSKPDDQQNVRSIETVLPPGQLAKLAGVPLCPAAAAPSGNCPAGSQIGSVSAAVGPGAFPLQVPQPGKAPTAVYLAGPYKGAPYSLAIKVPAQAGPFDLGTVAVRTALQVDPTTTQVTAKSDSLPQILDGVPLDYQNIAVSIDRPGFIQNPTNCEPMKVTGTISGSEGASASVSNRYQVGDCASLGFKPKLAINLKGGTKRHSFPALKATLTYPKGSYANIKKAQVTLPHSEFLEQSHIGTVCTRVQFAAKACPKASIYGKAKAISPLLDKPLSGPVYLRSSSNKLPDLVAELNGQINVVLSGKIDTGKGGGIRNTFQAVPDAPVSKFVLELKGGDKGLLVNSENICSKHAKTTAIADFTAQNGKVHDTTPTVSNSCGKAKKKSRGR